MSLASEASWDSCHQTDGSTPIPKAKDAPSGDKGGKPDLNPEPVAPLDDGNATPLKISELADHAGTADNGPESTDSQTSPFAISEPAVDPEFCFPDSNITVQAEESLFRVHEYKLMEFQDLKPLIEATQANSEGRKILRLEGTAEDIRNAFKVLYSSAYAPPSFDTDTLKSTLRFSTLHGHDQLRAFAIRKLEKVYLPPLERFALSRDCGVESWMSKALDDLCWREKPITAEEGEVLGMKKFAEVAARREAVKFERGSRVGLSRNAPPPIPSVSKPVKPGAPIPPPAPASAFTPRPIPTPKPASVPSATLYDYVQALSGLSASTIASNAPAPTGSSSLGPAPLSTPACASIRQRSPFGGIAPIAPISGSGFEAKVSTPSKPSLTPYAYFGTGCKNDETQPPDDGAMEWNEW
ncbi:hypothetical protein BDV93DRAFT_524268 [Ceratobasidium sp. AG-I]|nr:hypothetical protein BDV93DRAFT_524268 [Ceratobasidium sp. AG-I]